MTPFIQEYFNAERFESLFFVAVGIVATLISVYFVFVLKKPFFYGMAISLIFVALIQLVVGTTVFFRSPKDTIKVENILKNEPSNIKTQEIPRMEVVMKNFIIYRYVEIGLAILGIIFYFAFSTQTFTTSLLKGLGLGFAIQAILMLGLDFFAEKRGHEYLEHLIQLDKK